MIWRTFFIGFLFLLLLQPNYVIAAKDSINVLAVVPKQHIVVVDRRYSIKKIISNTSDTDVEIVVRLESEYGLVVPMSREIALEYLEVQNSNVIHSRGVVYEHSLWTSVSDLLYSILDKS